MIAGRASGSCTSISTRHSGAPYAREASTTSSGTCRMPRLVSRISGGKANVMVTMVAETKPILKKKTNGSMYTNEWTTCIASKIGRTTFHAPSTLPHKTPMGMPTITQTSTATPMKPIVKAVCRQNASPRRPQTSRPMNAIRPTWKLRMSQPISKTPMQMVSHDICSSHSFTMMLIRVSNGHLMTSIVACRLLSTQNTVCSTQSPTGICQLSSTVFCRTCATTPEVQLTSSSSASTSASRQYWVSPSTR